MEIEPPSGTIHVGKFGMDVNGRFWREPMVAPIECSKRVYASSRLHGCIVGVSDKGQDLIPGFVAWIDVSSNLLLEGLVEAFGEAIFLQMV